MFFFIFLLENEAKTLAQMFEEEQKSQWAGFRFTGSLKPGVVVCFLSRNFKQVADLVFKHSF